MPDIIYKPNFLNFVLIKLQLCSYLHSTVALRWDNSLLNLIQEIKRLTEENEKLRDRLKSTEQKTSAFLEEKSHMREQLDKMQTTMKSQRSGGVGCIFLGYRIVCFCCNEKAARVNTDYYEVVKNRRGV